MSLTKFCELLACQCTSLYSYGELNIMHVCLIIITMALQIDKGWGLLDSTETRTGAYITQNQKDWRRRKLKYKHSTGKPITFEFSDLGVGQLRSKNNNQFCSFGLSSFRPTEPILTHLRKIRNTRLRFVSLNFSFVC